MEDAGFRDRVRRAHTITATVCLNMRAGLAQVRMARAFRELCDQFATPLVRLAEVGLLYGRAYGHWEAGAIEEVGVPDATRSGAMPAIAHQGVARVAEPVSGGVPLPAPCGTPPTWAYWTHPAR